MHHGKGAVQSSLAVALNDPASASIEHLLTSLIEMPEETVIGRSALGSATQGALALLVVRILLQPAAC